MTEFPQFYLYDSQPEQVYRNSARRLAEARVRWAQAFQLARTREGSTDKQAAAAADEMTEAEIVVLEAELEIAKRRLGPA